jgi:prepilin signal peptidase PulO-like enzyme (type II secretory pathway)
MQGYYLFCFVVFGFIIGSAINSLAWRLGESISLKGRSICPFCRKKIAWYDNLPVISYVLLGGRCRFCRHRIPWHYAAIELAGAALFALIFWSLYAGPYYAFPPSSFWIAAICKAIIVSVLLFTFVFDARYYLISTSVIVPAAIIAGILNLLQGHSLFSLISTLAISIAFFGIQFVVTGRKGIGEGDVWLGGALALMFPDLKMWVVMIIISYFIGSLVGIGLVIFGKKDWKDKLPLGVFLSLGAMITLFFGTDIVSWYLGLLVL